MALTHAPLTYEAVSDYRYVLPESNRGTLVGADGEMAHTLLSSIIGARHGRIRYLLHRAHRTPAMSIPILRTKFYIPPARPSLVRRSALLERLTDAGMRPLTLISAPAGFGKTTLVCEWINEARTLATSGAPAPRAAWLSLDGSDNDPSRFLTYFILALQTQLPQVGISALELLGATQLAQPKAVLTLLLNEIGALEHEMADAPLLLVLDDYHLIVENAIHEALAFFIEHLPPALRLALVTRADPPLPLARWRAGRKLTEIRADDLRFTPREATLFLQQEMAITLSEAQVAILTTRTEGWVAGLQMAALALQGRPSDATFLREFSGSNRYVMDYLLEEVLAHLPKTTEKFLLETSIPAASRLACVRR